MMIMQIFVILPESVKLVGIITGEKFVMQVSLFMYYIFICYTLHRRRSSTTARLLRSWVRIPPESWMFVCCVCCVLSGRGLCDGLITRPEESYQPWRVVVCDQETSQ
jgi:hypothetical protein